MSGLGKRQLMAVAVAACVALAGCGGGSEDPEDSSGGTVELTFTNWISAEEPTIPAYQAMIAGFEKKYPNVKVKTSSLPFNQVKDQLLVSSAGGQAPDVAQIKQEWLPAVDTIGAAGSLDAFLSEDTLKDFYPNLVKEPAPRGGQSAPWAPSVVELYYNKTLLKQAGYDGSAPKSWNEMLEMAGKVAALGKNAQGGKAYGIGVSDKKLEGAGYFLLPWLWNNRGGDVLDANGNVVFNSPENVQTLETVASLLNDGVAPAGVEIKDLRNLFAQGQLGFYFDIEAAIGIHDKASPKGQEFRKEYGIAPVPGENGKPGRTFYTQHDLVAFKSSKHPQEAGQLIDFLSGPEGMAIYNANGGFKLPARQSVASIDYYESDTGKVLEPFLAGLPDSSALPATNQNFTTAMEALATAIARVENGEPAAEVVASTHTTLQSAYEVK